jgi:hypothetical protein
VLVCVKNIEAIFALGITKLSLDRAWIGNMLGFYRRQTMGLSHVAGVSGAVRVVLVYHCYWWEWQAVVLLHTDWKHRSFRMACSELVNCANVFRVGSSSSLYVGKYCACASVTFLAGIILSVDYEDSSLVQLTVCRIFADMSRVYRTCGWNGNPRRDHPLRIQFFSMVQQWATPPPPFQSLGWRQL